MDSTCRTDTQNNKLALLGNITAAYIYWLLKSTTYNFGLPTHVWSWKTNDILFSLHVIQKIIAEKMSTAKLLLSPSLYLYVVSMSQKAFRDEMVPFLSQPLPYLIWGLSHKIEDSTQIFHSTSYQYAHVFQSPSTSVWKDFPVSSMVLFG